MTELPERVSLDDFNDIPGEPDEPRVRLDDIGDEPLDDEEAT